MKLVANDIARLSSSLTALNLNWASYKGSFTTPLCDKAITQTHICPFMIALAAGFGVVSIKSARASMASMDQGSDLGKRFAEHIFSKIIWNMISS